MRKYFTLKVVLLLSVFIFFIPHTYVWGISDRIFCPAGQAELKGGCAKVILLPQ